MSDPNVWVEPVSSWPTSPHEVSGPELDLEIGDKFRFLFPRRAAALAGVLANGLITDTAVALPVPLDGRAISTLTTLGTVPANKFWVVNSLTLRNPNAYPVRAHVSIIESGGAVAAKHRIYSNLVQEYSTLVIGVPWFLSAGATIEARASSELTWSSVETLYMRGDVMQFSSQPQGLTLRTDVEGNGVLATTNWVTILTAAGPSVINALALCSINESAAVNAKIAIVPSGGDPAVSPQYSTFDNDIESGGYATFDGPNYLDTGDFIAIKAGSNTSIACRPTVTGLYVT